MYMLIRFPGGIIVEAVALAMGKNRMRVVAAGFPDAIEMRRSGEQWLDGAGQTAEFDFMMSNAREGDRVSSATPARLVRAAGQQAVLE